MSNQNLEFDRGDIIAANYEVYDRLGECPLGVSYRVKHKESGLFVRLNLLRRSVAGQEKKDEVIKAYRKAKETLHPNLMKIGELKEHEGTAYYTTEDFQGQSLRDIIQEYKVGERNFKLKDAAQVCLQILEALDVLHQNGTVVRAIRPEYVMVNVRYTGPRKQNFVAQVKLLHPFFWDLISTGTLAEEEFSLGEAQYLAPELKSFDPTPTPRCDNYSTAVIFYEMITGTVPLGTFQLPTMLRPELPSSVNDVVEMALSVAPEDRYKTAKDFISDLQRMVRDHASGIGESTPHKPLMSRIGWGIAIATSLAFLVIGANLLKPESNIEEKAAYADKLIRKECKEDQSVPDSDQIKKILAKHPANMVYVPEGCYVSGRMNEDPDAYSSERTAKKVTLPGFLIDAFEFPNKKNGVPVGKYTYSAAAAACKTEGKRLCTSSEWEKACKGSLNEIYSYGDIYDPEFCGEGLEDLGWASGSKENCKSKWPLGPFDMSGNYREWTSSSPRRDKARKYMKGGHPGQPRRGTRCSFSKDASVAFSDSDLSFRCCRSLNAPPVAPVKIDEAP